LSSGYFSGQQLAIRLYSPLGKYFRPTPWQELPLVALHGGTQYIFQAAHTASIKAARNKIDSSR